MFYSHDLDCFVMVDFKPVSLFFPYFCCDGLFVLQILKEMGREGFNHSKIVS